MGVKKAVLGAAMVVALLTAGTRRLQQHPTPPRPAA